MKYIVIELHTKKFAVCYQVIPGRGNWSVLCTCTNLTKACKVAGMLNDHERALECLSK